MSTIDSSSDALMLEILKTGEAYTAIQSQVGGDHVSTVIKDAFLKFDTINPSSFPPARSRVAVATVTYAKHLQSNMGNITEEHITEVLSDFSRRWEDAGDKATREDVKQTELEEKEKARPLTQAEKNQLIAKEVFEQRVNDRKAFERGDFTMDSIEVSRLSVNRDRARDLTEHEPLPSAGVASLTGGFVKSNSTPLFYCIANDHFLSLLLPSFSWSRRSSPRDSMTRWFAAVKRPSSAMRRVRSTWKSACITEIEQRTSPIVVLSLKTLAAHRKHSALPSGNSIFKTRRI